MLKKFFYGEVGEFWWKSFKKEKTSLLTSNYLVFSPSSPIPKIGLLF